MHRFDDALTLTSLGDGRYRGRTSPAYANMVGPFGGITNALMLHAVMRHPQRQGEPVALTVNFAAAIADGEFDIVAKPVRTSRSTQHWTIELKQGEDVQTTATAMFALRRVGEGWSGSEASAEVLPGPEGAAPPEALAASPTQGLPAWVRSYDIRAIEGGFERLLAGAAEEQSLTRLWLRNEPPRPLDFESLAAMADGFYPRVFLRLGRRVPAGTVSITTYFHADGATLRAQPAGSHLYGVARGMEFRDGYFDQAAELRTAEGRLLARSTQVVYFKG
jgi:hypothetical protein